MRRKIVAAGEHAATAELMLMFGECAAVGLHFDADVSPILHADGVRDSVPKIAAIPEFVQHLPDMAKGLFYDMPKAAASKLIGMSGAIDTILAHKNGDNAEALSLDKDIAAQKAQGREKIMNDAWTGLKGRYGGEDQIKHTLSTDPLGVMMDLASVLSGGEAHLRAAKAFTILKQDARALRDTFSPGLSDDALTASAQALHERQSPPTTDRAFNKAREKIQAKLHEPDNPALKARP